MLTLSRLFQVSCSGFRFVIMINTRIYLNMVSSRFAALNVAHSYRPIPNVAQNLVVCRSMNRNARIPKAVSFLNFAQTVK